MKQAVLYQRVESGFVFAASLYFYLHLHFHLLWFLVFLLSVDIFMLGYLVNKSFGAQVYNFGHSYVFPALLLIAGTFADNRLLLAAGLVWAAHISMDRAFGYGLKFTSDFKDTHLGKLK